jgi:hypothetical protein
VPYDQWDNLGPAASIVSNVNDLSHWLIFQLDSGKYKGKEILPFAVLQRTRDLITVTNSRKSTVYPVNIRGYGLGVFSSDYNGRQIFYHTGGAGGMVSNVCFVPEEKLGIAILTNNDNQNFFEALRYQILDAYLGVPFVNRSQQSLSNFRKGENAQLKKISDWKTRIKGSNPTLPLPEYAGQYTNQLYGRINITQEGNKLRVKFLTHPNLIGTLEYMDNDEWLLSFNNIEYGVFAVRFDIEQGRVKSVPIKVNDFIEYDPYIFVKQL